MSEKTVYVLGAGFTRAFVPQSPLLVGDYGIPQLQKNFASFKHAAAILDDALAQGTNGHINLERLMTRLSGMPYDSTDNRLELALLETALRKSLVQRIEGAKASGVDWQTMKEFANCVLAEKASIVTFNYDDALDKAL